MGIGDLGTMSALRTRMQWHQARQRLIAENVANADTPRFKAKDLAQPKMPVTSRASASGGVVAPVVTMAMTEPGHIAPRGGTGAFKAGDKQNFEVTPSGNAVDLEEQMTKSAENQLDYQTAASLYQQSLSLLRTALGRK